MQVDSGRSGYTQILHVRVPGREEKKEEVLFARLYGRLFGSQFVRMYTIRLRFNPEELRLERDAL